MNILVNLLSNISIVSNTIYVQCYTKNNPTLLDTDIDSFNDIEKCQCEISIINSISQKKQLKIDDANFNSIYIQCNTKNKNYSKALDMQIDTFNKDCEANNLSDIENGQNKIYSTNTTIIKLLR